MVRLSIVLFATLSVLPVGAWAQSRALGLDSSHVVLVRPRPSRGIEAGMPRGGHYERGILLDARAKYNDSYRAYARAHDRYRDRLRANPSRARLISGWIAKAKYQMVQSSRMISHRYIRGNRTSAARLFDRANIVHNKYLAIRAFTGDGASGLRQVVIRDYRSALRKKPGHRASRLGLATFYHELGHHLEARREFARVIKPYPHWLHLEVAHYYAAAGVTKAAMYYLKQAVFHHGASRFQARAGNHFDRLRDLPAYQRLVRR